MTDTSPIESLPSTDARVGEDGRYTLISLLGTGGMASVWSARDSRLDRTVAVKLISDTLALDPTFVARFEREARLVASLAHPHVVQVFDYGTHGNRPYLVMDYIGGGTLADRIAAGGGEWDPVVLAYELLDALAYIHSAYVLHRDLKPANVLIGTDGRARLTDFGIAQFADGTRMTGAGLLLGTAQYAAPEILRGEPPTAAGDLYSLGVVLRECALGSTRLAPVIEALTQADPLNRPDTADDALALLAGPPDSAAAPTVPMAVPVAGQDKTEPLLATRPEPVPSRRPTWLTPRRALAGLAVIAALIIVPLAAQGSGDAAPLELPANQGTVTEQLNRLDTLIDQSRQ